VYAFGSCRRISEKMHGWFPRAVATAGDTPGFGVLSRTPCKSGVVPQSAGIQFQILHDERRPDARIERSGIGVQKRGWGTRRNRNLCHKHNRRAYQ